jgi:hypothetical protein
MFCQFKDKHVIIYTYVLFTTTIDIWRFIYLIIDDIECSPITKPTSDLWSSLKIPSNNDPSSLSSKSYHQIPCGERKILVYITCLYIVYFSF